MTTLEQKLANQAAAKALHPAYEAANAACAAFAPGDVSDAALTAFCEAVNALRAVYYALNGFTAQYQEPVTFKRGGKYAKIILLNEQGEPRSVYCFIDLSNGNILKAAGYNAPAKHARGNITKGASQVGPHGPAYLK